MFTRIARRLSSVSVWVLRLLLFCALLIFALLLPACAGQPEQVADTCFNADVQEFAIWC